MAFNLFGKKNDQKSKGPKYYDLKVAEVINETSDAISIHFEKNTDIEYKSGQFLTFIVEINGKEVRRSYSLCSSPFTDDHLAVAIKRVEGGLVSNYLPDNLKKGDMVKIMEPMGSFTTEYQPENKRHVVMFAGGSGITPMLSLIKSLLHKEEKTVVTLIYANRGEDSIIFKKLLDEYQIKYEGRLHVIHIVDQAPMNWQGFSGLLNKDMLVELFERIPDWGPEHTTYLMCGPEGMMKNVNGLLKERGISEDKIFKESFVQGTLDKEDKKIDTAATSTESSQLTVHYDGDTYEFEVKAGQYILETALDSGYDLPFSCQSGLCTACRCKALSGTVVMDEDEGLSESELKDGYVLICVGKAGSDKIELEVG